MEDDMRPRPNDLRVEKTIDAIKSAFKDMLLEMDYDKITVKDLCARARVNKKTFYRYYPAIEYLLLEIQQQYAVPYAEKTKNLSLPKDVSAITRTFLEFSVAQDKLYERITCSGPLDVIRGQMIEIVEKERNNFAADKAPINWPEGAWDIYLSFVGTVPLHAYQTWVTSGKKMPVNDMIETTVATVTAGSKAFEKAIAGFKQKQ